MCGSCGECHRCKQAAYMREWWRKLSPERKREYLNKRGPDPRRGKRPQAEDPVKAKARTMVSNRIRRGQLERQPCEVCAATEGVQAHHDDYSKPLDVRWLCRKHHGEVHRVYRDGTEEAA